LEEYFAIFRVDVKAIQEAMMKQAEKRTTEMPVVFQRSKRRYIPEDKTFLTTVVRTSVSVFLSLLLLFSSIFLYCPQD
jgi:hypothetical protein